MVNGTNIFLYIKKVHAKARTTTADKTIIRKRKISVSETLSTSNAKEASSSASSTNTVKALTSASYQALSTAFNQMSETKKWKFKDGIYVEDLLVVSTLISSA